MIYDTTPTTFEAIVIFIITLGIYLAIAKYCGKCKIYLIEKFPWYKTVYDWGLQFIFDKFKIFIFIIIIFFIFVQILGFLRGCGLFLSR